MVAGVLIKLFAFFRAVLHLEPHHDLLVSFVAAGSNKGARRKGFLAEIVSTMPGLQIAGPSRRRGRGIGRCHVERE